VSIDLKHGLDEGNATIDEVDQALNETCFNVADGWITLGL